MLDPLKVLGRFRNVLVTPFCFGNARTLIFVYWSLVIIEQSVMRQGKIFSSSFISA